MNDTTAHPPPSRSDSEDLPPKNQAGPSLSEPDLGKLDRGLTSIFSEDVTETGSFRVRPDWLEPMWSILEALPAGVMVIDGSRRVIFGNGVCRRLLRGDRDLEGRLFSSLFSDPGDAVKVQSVADEVYTAATPRTVHAQLFSATRKIWARLSFRPLRIDQDRYVLILVEDLTAEREKLELIEKHREELLEARAKLDKSNAQLRREMEAHQKARVNIERAKREWERTFDAVPDLIAIVDTDYRMLRVNKALADRLGKSYDEIVGTQCFHTMHCSDTPYPQCPHGKMLLNGKPHRTEVSDDNLGGVFDVTVSPLHDEQGRLIGSVHVARDITEVKKAHQLLLETGRARVVAELAGMAAHSFNNLLQIAMGGSQLCLTNLELGNYSNVKDGLDGILEELRRGARTVRRLTFLARAYGPPSFHEDRILDLSATVHQALDMCSPWWKTLPEREGIKITLKRDLGPDCIVKGDPDELLEVVVDLVKNAAEALPHGGNIEVRTHKEGHRVSLTVRDNGEGIPQENLSKVFQPLWSTKASSAGMGLERVNRTVERHGGKVHLASRPGIGTTVNILLPAEEAQEGEAESFVTAEPGPTCRILLVDDLEPVVRVLASGLDQVGHKVFPCLSGSRAVELFKASAFDLVICDLGMPGMNGWQVAGTLKELAEAMNRPKTPFILLTGWGGHASQNDMMNKHGVDYIMEKPIEIAELTNVIRRVTGKS